MGTMTWDEMRTMPITAEAIEAARAAGACKEALRWAEAEPRTWGEVSVKGVGWYGLCAATPEQISACIEGTCAEWCGWIGSERADLSPAQIDACIAGTNTWGRGLIGAYRRDLTPAQLDACIAGTNAEGHWLIGATRRDLTPAQRAACGA